MKKNGTFIYRASIAVLNVVVIAMLGYLSKEVIPFTVNGYSRWKKQDEETQELKKMLTDYMKHQSEKEIIYSAAVKLNADELQALQLQTNNNTEAIYTILSKK